MRKPSNVGRPSFTIWALPGALAGMNTPEVRKACGVDRGQLGRMIAGRKRASTSLVVAWALHGNGGEFGERFEVRAGR